MKEYVSYEVAKLLREKGYNEPTKGFYTTQGLFSYGVSDITNAKRNIYNYISAPSLAQASKWLRERFSIFVTVFPVYDRTCEIIDYRVRLTEYSDLIDNKKGKLLPVWFEPYNQALNEGIKEALKLIENETDN